MTTKHRADELADYLEKSIEVTYYDMTSEPYAEITDESYRIICQAATLLRTIPALEADVERLKHDLQMALDVCLANQSWMIKLREFVNECK